MASAWGESWGAAWGNSWGLRSPVPVDAGYGSGGRKKRHKEPERREERQLFDVGAGYLAYVRAKKQVEDDEFLMMM
mgnify:CR=1 FL=1